MFFQCLFSTSGSASGSANINFTAPATGGIYYVTLASSWHSSCISVNHSTDPAKAMAVLVIAEPCSEITATVEPGVSSTTVHFYTDATDNCTSPPLLVSGLESGSEFQVGSHLIQYADASGNIAECVTTVNIINPGCIAPAACNYNPWASDNDGTCIFPPDCQTPAPGMFAATTNAFFRRVDLVWGHLAPGAQSVNIYRNGQLLANTANLGSAQSGIMTNAIYSDETAAPAQTYQYCIEAIDDYGFASAQVCDTGSTLPFQLMASDSVDDAHIELSRDLDVNCLSGENGEVVFLQLIDMETGAPIHQETIDDISNLAVSYDFTPSSVLDFDGNYDGLLLRNLDTAAGSGWTFETLVNRRSGSNAMQTILELHL